MLELRADQSTQLQQVAAVGDKDFYCFQCWASTFRKRDSDNHGGAEDRPGSVAGEAALRVRERANSLGPDGLAHALSALGLQQLETASSVAAEPHHVLSAQHGYHAE
ncbi:hypothetical protein scyTo_0022719 [Scyliorhinus torazame]|uniref:Uncharacterized protein n=1 Tax=Scyliorhinus torazame TaxID=75743 RepID=A0A401Q643_SCYTO|nr:hypothetical protein [Scyliorhinus torazame]